MFLRSVDSHTHTWAVFVCDQFFCSKSEIRRRYKFWILEISGLDCRRRLVPGGAHWKCWTILSVCKCKAFKVFSQNFAVWTFTHFTHFGIGEQRQAAEDGSKIVNNMDFPFCFHCAGGEYWIFAEFRTTASIGWNGFGRTVWENSFRWMALAKQYPPAIRCIPPDISIAFLAAATLLSSLKILIPAKEKRNSHCSGIRNVCHSNRLTNFIM